MTNLIIQFEPYSYWETRAVADARRATQPQYMHGMTEILQAEAPMQALHLFQTYAKAGGLMKIAAPVKSRMSRALWQGVKDGHIILEKETDSEVDNVDDPVGWVVRLPDMSSVRVRDLGPRSFAEIPASELAALVLDIKAQDEFMGRDDIYRAILDHYSLQKLTALVRRRLNHVLEQYF